MAYGGRRLGVAVVAAILLLLIVLLVAAAPAFAQNNGSNQYNTNTAVCQIVFDELNIVADQSGNQAINVGPVVQYNSNNEQIAAVANELNISINMVNECLNSFGDDDNGDDTTGDDTTGDDTTGVGGTTTGVPTEGVIASTIPEKGLLPVTGGMPLLSSGVVLGLAIIGTGLAILRAETRRGSDRSGER